MSVSTLTPRLTAATEDRTSGATGVARQVMDGLLEIVDDTERLRAAADQLTRTLTGYASMWHITRAAYGEHPARALRELRERLDFDVERSVASAAKLLAERGGPVRTAPSSSVVKAVVAALPPADPTRPVSGLAGADAVSPTTVLNIIGTHELARAVPTIVVTTSLKLISESEFRRLSLPLLEPVPLSLFEAVVLDGEVLTPVEAGRRAASIS